MRIRLLVALCCLLSACGFHLRGHLEHVPPSVHLITDKPFDQFSKQIKRELGHEHIILDAHSPYSIHILDTNLTERRTTVSSSTQIRQYVLTFTVHYQFDHQHPVIPKQITIRRNYTRDESQMLGSSNEQYTIVREMHQAASHRLLRQFGRSYETQIKSINNTHK